MNKKIKYLFTQAAIAFASATLVFGEGGASSSANDSKPVNPLVTEGALSKEMAAETTEAKINRLVKEGLDGIIADIEQRGGKMAHFVVEQRPLYAQTNSAPLSLSEMDFFLEAMSVEVHKWAEAEKQSKEAGEKLLQLQQSEGADPGAVLKQQELQTISLSNQDAAEENVIKLILMPRDAAIKILRERYPAPAEKAKSAESVVKAPSPV